ncbi:hypothetical protein FB45DRAFT_908286 [Roridomyces roridus]|uniref:BZIP domain-containing protein n=1 Tax=Roridomyces roridus TaxID=1738132 RepID=A0AAD7C2H0_9AGAR|nr:hypothetical protein FB45DRAFT_908286 [Roridomyces roridus]
MDIPSLAQGHWHTSPMLSSTAVFDDADDDVFDQPQLTSDCRRPRPHLLIVPPPTIFPSNTTQPVAISVPADNTLATKCQDVRSLNPSASFRPPSPAPRFNGFPISPLESPLSSPDLNTDTTRPRTSFQIFSSTQDLAAHHGIPQTLPPPPRPVAAPRKPSPAPTDFNSMLSNYLAMRAHHSDTPATASAAVDPSALESHDIESTMRALDNFMGIPQPLSRRHPSSNPMLAASPEFRSLGDSFDEASPLIDEDALFNYDSACGGDESPLFDSPFLTSPFEESVGDFTSPIDTPFSEFLGTPAIGMLGDDFGTGPLITGGAEHGWDAPLFGDAGLTPDSPAPSALPKLPNTANMWEISPDTPALDSIEPAATTSTKTGPVIPPPPPPAPLASLRRRSGGSTGTRKNITANSLIPLDAPTQKRTYLTPSATSRKAVPAVFAKKRAHSVAFGDDEDDLGQLSPTASEQETIEYKRRQNTIAARKSRKRKLAHQQELEDSVVKLEQEVTMWRERAMMGQEMLRGHGIMFSFDGTQP